MYTIRCLIKGIIRLNINLLVINLLFSGFLFIRFPILFRQVSFLLCLSVILKIFYDLEWVFTFFVFKFLFFDSKQSPVQYRFCQSFHLSFIGVNRSHTPFTPLSVRAKDTCPYSDHVRPSIESLEIYDYMKLGNHWEDTVIGYLKSWLIRLLYISFYEERHDKCFKFFV